MIEKALRVFLLDAAEIRNIVAERLYKGHVPQGTKGAAIVLQSPGVERMYSLENEVGLSDKIVQVDCYESDPVKAETLFEKVRDRLSGYRGSLGDVDATTVEGVRIVNERATTDEPTDASDRWVHRYSADFAMFVSQSVPTHA